jgi:hypothetical protein
VWYGIELKGAKRCSAASPLRQLKQKEAECKGGAGHEHRGSSSTVWQSTRRRGFQNPQGGPNER